MRTLGYWAGAFWTLVVIIESWVLLLLFEAVEKWK
jgi:hypothetical protein